MSLAAISLITGTELVLGYILGRLLIPYFRKLKTGKFDLYIGDRFKKDGSEPRLGGVLIFICIMVGILIGTAFFSSKNELGTVTDVRYIIASMTAAGLLCALGSFEDRIRDKGLPVGIKPLYKLIFEFAVIMSALIMLRLFGRMNTAILLPFRLGFLELGILYYPVTALLGTLFLSAVRICDCPSGRTELGVDGLCPTCLMIFFMAVSSGLTATEIRPDAQLISYAAMGAAGGYLFWGLHPSKLYFGESGALTLGAMAVMASVLANAELLLLIGGGAVMIDAFCALLQYAVFRINKKLLFKGYTLHEHMLKKGAGEYKIIGAAAVTQIVFAAAQIMFIAYSAKFLV